KGHNSDVRSVAFSPDGRTIVTASNDSTMKMWNIETGNTIGLIKGYEWFECVVFSPDGKYLAAASHGKTIKIWDVKTLITDNNKPDSTQSDDSTSEDSNQLLHSYQLNQIGGFNIYVSSIEYGWVEDNSHIFFWVPDHIRRRLCDHETVQTLGEKMVKLDLSKFKHGKDWTE
ncbi:hypothetical protein BDQ17DRAFT_1167239, partial [Cyathus striatus]